MASQPKCTRFSLDEAVPRFDFENIPESDDGGLSGGEESLLDRQLLNSDSGQR